MARISRKGLTTNLLLQMLEEAIDKYYSVLENAHALASEGKFAQSQQLLKEWINEESEWFHDLMNFKSSLMLHYSPEEIKADIVLLSADHIDSYIRQSLISTHADLDETNKPALDAAVRSVKDGYIPIHLDHQTFYAEPPKQVRKT